MQLDILGIGDPKLRRTAERIEKMGGDELGLARSMVAAMRQANGVGLAAPQVGVNRRLVVIEVPAGHESDDTEEWDWDQTQLLCLANPVIWELNDFRSVEEGCLSLPGFITTISRAGHVVAEAWGLDGKRFTVDARGLLAQAIQHELDHLDGGLVSDRAGSIMNMRQVKPAWIAGSDRKRRRRASDDAGTESA